MRAHFLACILILIGHAATAQAVDSAPAPAADTCLPGIVAAEQAFALPSKLLLTIGIVESGRTDPATGAVAPWPWTINVAGTDHIFASKQAAIDAVQELQRQGTQSIDIGCMQINLLHHPNAFASLDEAFDPASNTQYGARFLSALYHETGNWLQAAAAYHSRTEEIGASYETRVMAMWPLAGQFPDATLEQRRRAITPEDDMRRLTPEFAARVKQMRADRARLLAMSAPVARPARQPAGPDYSRYTPEFAARLKAMDRARAAHVASVAASEPVRMRHPEEAAGGVVIMRGSTRVRLADVR